MSGVLPKGSKSMSKALSDLRKANKSVGKAFKSGRARSRALKAAKGTEAKVKVLRSKKF